MRKEFNDTGLCVADRHFMVDTTPKMDQIFQLIEKRKYFTINRPRQFGKTTTSQLLNNHFQENEEYLLLNISFEDVTDQIFGSEVALVEVLLRLIKEELVAENLIQLIDKYLSSTKTFFELSAFISELVQVSNHKIILLIDEVDAAANHDLFLKLLALLRKKYLKADDHTFHSVILIGVHDIKNLKRKIRPDEQITINSPWNIAADFTVDMTFNPQEIQSMLRQYHEETGINLDIPTVADKIHYYTSGYPYLVSKMCKVIDEILIKDRDNKDWNMEDVEDSFKYLVKGSYTTTLFDSLAKYLHNYEDLNNMIFEIVYNGKVYPFALTNNLVAVAAMYGIIREQDDKCLIHNRIFEKRLYDKFLVDNIDSTPQEAWIDFETEDGGLDLPKALLAFQKFMEENHADRDEKFLEREGRLIFSAFLRPMLNGRGSDFKEPIIDDERRADIVLAYGGNKYVIELKIWRGERYHKKGLQQLSDYLDLYSLKEGYLLIYDFNKTKEYRHEEISFQDKKIFAVWV